MKKFFNIVASIIAVLIVLKGCVLTNETSSRTEQSQTVTEVRKGDLITILDGGVVTLTIANDKLYTSYLVAQDRKSREMMIQLGEAFIISGDTSVKIIGSNAETGNLWVEVTNGIFQDQKAFVNSGFLKEKVKYIE